MYAPLMLLASLQSAAACDVFNKQCCITIRDKKANMKFTFYVYVYLIMFAPNKETLKSPVGETLRIKVITKLEVGLRDEPFRMSCNHIRRTLMYL